MAPPPKLQCPQGHSLRIGSNNVYMYNGHRACKICQLERTKERRASGSDADRRQWLKWKYGLTLEEYNEMWEAQEGLCAICGGPQQKGKQLCVDHNHETGEIRGLLCTMCNIGIATFNEDPNLFLSAQSYIVKWNN